MLDEKCRPRRVHQLSVVVHVRVKSTVVNLYAGEARARLSFFFVSGGFQSKQGAVSPLSSKTNSRKCNKMTNDLLDVAGVRQVLQQSQPKTNPSEKV